MRPGSRLVVVHRDPDLRELVAEACHPPELWAHTFALASTALALIHELRPHCVVSELQLPDMEAERFLSELRGRQGITAPFIVVGPRKEEARIQSVLDAGAEAYLLEPFPLRELFDKVRSLVSAVDRSPRLEAPAPPASLHSSVPLAKRDLSNDVRPVSDAVTVVVTPVVESADGDGPSSAVRRQELWPNAAPGLGRFTRLDVRGHSLVVLTEASLRPRFVITTVITEKGSALRKIQTELPQPMSREEDGEIVREQVNQQHEDSLARLESLVLVAGRKRRAVWPRPHTV